MPHGQEDFVEQSKLAWGKMIDKLTEIIGKGWYCWQGGVFVGRIAGDCDPYNFFEQFSLKVKTSPISLLTIRVVLPTSQLVHLCRPIFFQYIFPQIIEVLQLYGVYDKPFHPILCQSLTQ